MCLTCVFCGLTAPLFTQRKPCCRILRAPGTLPRADLIRGQAPPGCSAGRSCRGEKHPPGLLLLGSIESPPSALAAPDGAHVTAEATSEGPPSPLLPAACAGSSASQRPPEATPAAARAQNISRFPEREGSQHRTRSRCPAPRLPLPAAAAPARGTRGRAGGSGSAAAGGDAPWSTPVQRLGSQQGPPPPSGLQLEQLEPRCGLGKGGRGERTARAPLPGQRRSWAPPRL